MDHEAVLRRIGVPLRPDLAGQPLSSGKPQPRYAVSSLGITQIVTRGRNGTTTVQHVVRAIDLPEHTHLPVERATQRFERTPREVFDPLGVQRRATDRIERVCAAVAEPSGGQVSHRDPAPV